MGSKEGVGVWNRGGNVGRAGLKDDAGGSDRGRITRTESPHGQMGVGLGERGQREGGVGDLVSAMGTGLLGTAETAGCITRRATASVRSRPPMVPRTCSCSFSSRMTWHDIKTWGRQGTRDQARDEGRARDEGPGKGGGMGGCT